MKTITLNEILSSNPQIDKKLLEKARNLRRELHQIGVSGHRYNLSSPFHRRFNPIAKKS